MQCNDMHQVCIVLQCCLTSRDGATIMCAWHLMESRLPILIGFPSSHPRLSAQWQVCASTYSFLCGAIFVYAHEFSSVTTFQLQTRLRGMFGAERAIMKSFTLGEGKEQRFVAYMLQLTEPKASAHSPDADRCMLFPLDCFPCTANTVTNSRFVKFVTVTVLFLSQRWPRSKGVLQ